jgi:hypothetical protein
MFEFPFKLFGFELHLHWERKKAQAASEPARYPHQLARPLLETIPTGAEPAGPVPMPVPYVGAPVYVYAQGDVYVWGPGTAVRIHRSADGTKTITAYSR